MTTGRINQVAFLRTTPARGAARRRPRLAAQAAPIGPAPALVPESRALAARATAGQSASAQRPAPSPRGPDARRQTPGRETPRRRHPIHRTRIARRRTEAPTGRPQAARGTLGAQQLVASPPHPRSAGGGEPTHIAFRSRHCHPTTIPHRPSQLALRESQIEKARRSRSAALGRGSRGHHTPDTTHAPTRRREASAAPIRDRKPATKVVGQRGRKIEKRQAPGATPCAINPKAHVEGEDPRLRGRRAPQSWHPIVRAGA